MAMNKSGKMGRGGPLREEGERDGEERERRNDKNGDIYH